MNRPRVTKLHRIDGTDLYPGYFYYTPDGHCIGPYANAEIREQDVAKYYEEVDETHKPNPYR